MDLREFYEKEVYKSPLNKKSTLCAKFVIKAINSFVFEKKKVLDIGAGEGFLLKSLKAKGADVYAVELSEQCIEYLRTQEIDTRKVDISTENLPFPSESFDYIFFTEVIEHLIFPQHILREIRRVLKPDGMLVITTHNTFNFYMRTKYLMGKIPNADLDVTKSAQHIRLFNFEIFLKLVKEAGFTRYQNKSRFEFRKISFQTPKQFTPLFANYFLLICSK